MAELVADCPSCGAIAASFLTFLLGLFLGHRLSLWRERRKEFNEVAVRIRVVLMAHQADLRPYRKSVDSADLEVFRHLLPARKKLSFARAWTAYEAAEANTVQDAYGQSSYGNPESVAAALRRLIRFTSLR